MTATIVDGRKIGSEIKKQIKKEITALTTQYPTPPHITTVSVGHDPSSLLYAQLRDRACHDVGIHTNHISLSETVSERDVLKHIEQLNTNSNVHGILVQFPLPKQLSSDTILAAIRPHKDVEGFHPCNLGRLFLGDEHLVPCTPRAVLRILDHEQVHVKGKNVVVVNHSMVVGKPLAALLLNRNATVSVCHEFTADLQCYTRSADVLVTATGVANMIKRNHVKKGAFVIDVGIIQTKQGIRGDVDFDDVKTVAGTLTPVPGGVGPVTIACSLQNMVKTYKNCMDTHE